MVWGLGVVQLLLFLNAERLPSFLKLLEIGMSAVGVYIALIGLRIGSILARSDEGDSISGQEEHQDDQDTAPLDKDVAVREAGTVALMGIAGLAMNILFTEYVDHFLVRWDMVIVCLVSLALYGITFFDTDFRLERLGFGRSLTEWLSVGNPERTVRKKGRLRALDVVHATMGVGAYTLIFPAYPMILAAIALIRYRGKKDGSSPDVPHAVIRASWHDSRSHGALLSFVELIGVLLMLLLITLDWSTWTQIVGVTLLAGFLLILFAILSGDFIQPSSKLSISLVSTGAIFVPIILVWFTFSDPSFNPLVVFGNAVASAAWADSSGMIAWFQPVYQYRAPYFASLFMLSLIISSMMSLFASYARIAGKPRLHGVLLALAVVFFSALILASFNSILLGIITAYNVQLQGFETGQIGAIFIMVIFTQLAGMTVAAVVYGVLGKDLAPIPKKWYRLIVNAGLIVVFIVSVIPGAIGIYQYHKNSEHVPEKIIQQYQLLADADTLDDKLQVASRSPYHMIRYQALFEAARSDDDSPDFDEMIQSMPGLLRLQQRLSPPLSEDAATMLSILNRLKPVYYSAQESEKQESWPDPYMVEMRFRARFWNTLLGEVIRSGQFLR